MPRKGLYVPKLYDKNVRRLYHTAKRFTMPVSRLPGSFSFRIGVA